MIEGYAAEILPWETNDRERRHDPSHHSLDEAGGGVAQSVRQSDRPYCPPHNSATFLAGHGEICHPHG